MSLLITRPRHDTPTHYLFHWSKEIIDTAKSKGIDFFDIKQKKVTKKTVESYLRKKSPEIVILNGHGDKNTVAGHENEILISVDDNSHLLKDKKVYIRVCNSGENLGSDIMKSGATGFIGYKNPFMFPIDNNSFSKPLDDKIAKPCLECSNKIATSLVKGCSIKEAHDKSKKMVSKKIDEMYTSEEPNTYIIGFLQWNDMNQVCYEA